MVNKITTPPTQNEVIDKINELVDVSGNKVNGAPLSNTSSHFFGVSTSAATDVEKVVSIPSITELTVGVAIIVLPTTTNSVANATLKLNNFDAYPMRYQNLAITTTTDAYTWTANTPSVFVFDGDYWQFVCQGYRQVYSAMSVSEGTTGTKTTARTVRADYLKQIIQGTTLTGISTSTNSAVTASDTVTTGIGKLQAQVNGKQETLVSGTNIKTVGGTSLLGSGNISVPTTTSSVTSGSTAALTSGGAYTNLVRRKSTSSATGSSSQGVYVNSSGQVQPCDAVTSTYAATGTAPVNGKAVSNAIATKQDNLVSGTNIKTINGTSLLGSGNITIETSSTPNVDGETISYNSSDALQAIAVKNVRDGSTLPIWHGTEYQWNHGDPTTWYYWQTAVQAQWVSGGNLPSSNSWSTISFGNGVFIIIKMYDTESAYSTNDGVTWQTGGNLPSSGSWQNLSYGNNNFVVSSSNNPAYSTDNGLTWVSSTMPTGIYKTYLMTYGNGRFVAISSGENGKQIVYSDDDGVTWQKGGVLPYYGNEGSGSLAFGDGTFVFISYSGQTYYSTDDGGTWQTGVKLNFNANGKCLSYGNGRFVALSYGYNKSAYSTDGGVTWQSGGNLPVSGGWSIIFADGIFVALAYNKNRSFYSTDGVTWTESGYLPTSSTWKEIAYGNGKFLTFSYNSNLSAIFSITYDKCYTDTANPTTTSVVYSAPNTASALTISSVTSGAITLSNNNTYYYNQSGNTYTYDTIGNSHPEYLCFIDGVGVKMGNTTIATNNSNNS